MCLTLEQAQRYSFGAIKKKQLPEKGVSKEVKDAKNKDNNISIIVNKKRFTVMNLFL
jgi:hypothetical protein